MSLILIVEDEPFIRESAEWMVEDLGHTVLSAADLEGALAHLSAAAPIDALFVDMRLSRLASGGYEVADRGVELQPHLRVLYTSGTPLTADMTEQFVLGGQFIQKPYTPELLEAALALLLRGQDSQHTIAVGA